MWLHRRQEAGFAPARGPEDLRKLEIALEQLERAELYVCAAIAVELGDPGRQRELEDLRAQVSATRRSLSRPRLVEESG